jgi:nucleotide-binding universal stress UspA family protein
MSQCHDSYEPYENALTSSPVPDVHIADSEVRSRGRVVVGVDGSQASKDALRWAARQAQLTGCLLEPVLSWEMSPNTYGFPTPVPIGYDPASNAKELLHETVHSVLGEVGDLEVAPSIVEGPAVQALLREAQGAELLVVGTRGHSPVVGMLLGSVSEQCAMRAPCPVVVVHESHLAA